MTTRSRTQQIYKENGVLENKNRINGKRTALGAGLRDVSNQYSQDKGGVMPKKKNLKKDTTEYASDRQVMPKNKNLKKDTTEYTSDRQGRTRAAKKANGDKLMWWNINETIGKERERERERENGKEKEKDNDNDNDDNDDNDEDDDEGIYFDEGFEEDDFYTDGDDSDSDDSDNDDEVKRKTGIKMELNNASSIKKIVLPPGIVDIDIIDKDYPEYCIDYSNEIYEYLHTVQIKHKVNHRYMGLQPDITEKMRSILVDWLVDVHLRFKLTQETLYLTVSIIDRFLSDVVISRHKLQLVGVSAMLIASKFEEIYSPEVNDFVYITDDGYERDEILEMERLILNTMKFNIASVYPIHFLRRASKVAEADPRTHTMAKYLLELTLPYLETLRYQSSLKAAAALCLARMMLHCGTWNEDIEYYTKHKEVELLDCVHEIFFIAKNAKNSQFKAVHKKYNSPLYFSVSQIADSQIQNAQYMN